MLIVPFVVGVGLRLRDAQVDWLAKTTLFATWLIGYLAFNAVSLWLKSAPAKRPAAVPPAVTYVGLTAVFGLTTLALVGPRIALWLISFAPLLSVALVLASRRKERATIGGALTILAASLMLLVARFDDPLEALASPSQSAVMVTVLCFAYFFGTVLYVKTMIRERGKPTWVRASVGYHAAWTLLAAGPAVAALLLGEPAGWWIGWMSFFALTTFRSWFMPQLGERRKLRPGALGVVEIAFSLAFVILALV